MTPIDLLLEKPRCRRQVWLTESSYPQNIQRTMAPVVNELAADPQAESFVPIARRVSAYPNSTAKVAKTPRWRGDAGSVAIPWRSWRPWRWQRRLRRKMDQTACKPGSVPPAPKRRHWRSFLWTAPRGTVLATYPDRSGLRQPYPPCDGRTVPIRSCSWRGLPCHACYQARGGLLPHPFTLPSRKERRFAFCGAIPGVAPGGRYPPPFRRGARTFLHPPKGTATARPSGPPQRWAPGPPGSSSARQAPATGRRR